jgi:hypothetical protein
MSKKKLAGIIIACTIAIIVVIFVVSARVPTEPATPGTSPPTEDLGGIKITTGDLSDEYKENEIAADHKYKNRVLIIVGLITDISRDPQTNKPYVSVGKSLSLEWVRCFFDKEDQLLGLAKGEEVIVKGKCLGKKEDKEGTSFPIVFKNCSLIEETEFQVTGWEVIISPYNPPSVDLKVSFKKFGRSVTAYLNNPEGRETSAYLSCPARNYAGLDCTEGVFTLSMTEGSLQTPIAGDYQIVVKDSNENILTTKTFSFRGVQPEVEITDVSGHWEHDIEYDPSLHQWGLGPSKEVHYSVRLMVNIKNSGDLPFYFTWIAVKVPNDDSQGGSYECKRGIAPGEEETVSISTQYEDWFSRGIKYRPESFYFRSPGDKILTLEFRDGTGKVAYSMNTTITVPEKPPGE